MHSLDQFKSNNQPKSKLKKYRIDILNLFDEGFSLKQIQEFLLKNKVKISRQAINNFILKNVIVDDETIAEKPKKKKNESGRSANLIKRLGGDR